LREITDLKVVGPRRPGRKGVQESEGRLVSPLASCGDVSHEGKGKEKTNQPNSVVRPEETNRKDEKVQKIFAKQLRKHRKARHRAWT